MGGQYLALNHAPYVWYGVEYIGLVSLVVLNILA